MKEGEEPKRLASFSPSSRLEDGKSRSGIRTFHGEEGHEEEIPSNQGEADPSRFVGS